ncbi:hypothetical protein [Bradyrhizobium cajani]|uniref:Uncharacterized protein n=1 Tax=Bradyrhizobium cajani TaxID=1928661 RepID=A0A844TLN8_9BRAD|nr:hypothetical protein [Bradyrhizobium cajani]MCP3370776.1 hypothetical protein [Bradyrhizobium cajani]MVT75881.1 hypothetical protein [Bradyrhizobium cajani]
MDYAGLVQAVRDRLEQMEMSRSELDHVGGLTCGHTDKILRPVPEKRFGITSLGTILQTLGLIMIIVEDPAARDKTLARREPFSASNRRVGNKCHLGRKVWDLAPDDGGSPRQFQMVSTRAAKLIETFPDRYRFVVDGEPAPTERSDGAPAPAAPRLVHEQPAASPREGTGHAHLRVVQEKRGHKFG